MCFTATIFAVIRYLGWFSSYVQDLYPLTPRDKASKLVAFAGGRDSILSAAQTAKEERDFQWALELSSAVFRLDSSDVTALEIRTEALKGLAGLASSSNGRNYYLTSVLEDHGIVGKNTQNPVKGYVNDVSMEKLVKSLSLWVHGERCANADNKLVFNVSDTQEVYSLHMRNGILDAKKIAQLPLKYRTLVLIPSTLLREVLGQIRPSNDILKSESVKFIGDKTFVKSFFKCIDFPAQ